MAKNYWLMKSEPDVFSIQDLKSRKNSVEHWDGVRNYQARNYMRDDMKTGDEVIFYHSNTTPPHAAGVVKIDKEAYPDPTCWDKKSKYYDPKSTKEKPRWVMVDVKYVQEFKKIVSLEDMKNNPNLAEMKLVQKGNRLSIIPISKSEFEEIKKMASK